MFSKEEALEKICESNIEVSESESDGSDNMQDCQEQWSSSKSDSNDNWVFGDNVDDAQEPPGLQQS